MKASTRIIMSKRTYRADVAKEILGGILEVAIIWGMVYMIIDGLFPNTPL